MVHIELRPPPGSTVHRILRVERLLDEILLETTALLVDPETDDDQREYASSVRALAERGRYTPDGSWSVNVAGFDPNGPAAFAEFVSVEFAELGIHGDYTITDPHGDLLTEVTFGPTLMHLPVASAHG